MIFGFSLSLLYRFWGLFWCQLGLIFRPQIRKIHQKWKSKTHRFLALILASIFVHLGSILGPKLGPCWRLLAHKTHPRSTKKKKKVIQNAQDCPRRVPDPSGIPPDLDFGAPEPRCSVDLGSLLGYFWTLVFQYFFIDCSSLFPPNYGMVFM